MSSPSKSAKKISVAQHVDLANADPLTELFRQFLHRQEEGFYCRMEADLLIAQMLVQIGFAAEAPQVSDSVATIASHAQQLIDTDFVRAELSPGSIAQQLNFNPDYLNRVFKRVYGQNIGSYLCQRRLRQARRLLQESQLTVNEIAHAVGFADAGYFRRIFKKRFDMTPTHFRRLHFRAHVNVG